MAPGRRLVVASSLILGAGWLFHFFDPGLPVHWLFGLAFGFVLQKSGFCFVSAVRDPLLTGSTALARALILAIGIATIGFALVTLSTGVTGTIARAGWNTVVGGILFGAGMVVAGGCVSGTLMRMGEGFTMQWVAFAGLLGGSLLGAWSCCSWTSPLLDGSAKVFLPDRLGWPGALLVQASALLVLWWLAVRHERRQFALNAVEDPDTTADLPARLPIATRERVQAALRSLWVESWPPAVGGLILGLLNIGYFVSAGRPWGITTELTYWASSIWRLLGQYPEQWAYFAQSGRPVPWGLDVLSHPGTALNIGLIAGALLASYLAGQWRVRRMRSWRQTVAALVGGLAMGYGSRLSLGCNIGALFSGTASLSLHGWLYLAALAVGAAVGLRIAHVFLFRPALRRLTSGTPARFTAGAH